MNSVSEIQPTIYIPEDTSYTEKAMSEQYTDVEVDFRDEEQVGNATLADDSKETYRFLRDADNQLKCFCHKRGISLNYEPLEIERI